MSIERSKGKARPTLPRSSDLKPVRAAEQRSDVRDREGRFAPGNAGGMGRGWKRAIGKMLGQCTQELSDVAARVAADAWRLFTVAIKEMPHDGPNVRALVARKARHEALEGYWSAQALANLGTPKGDAAESRATLHGQRAERLTVSALDVARVLAAAQPRVPKDWRAAFSAAAPADDDDAPATPPTNVPVVQVPPEPAEDEPVLEAPASLSQSSPDESPQEPRDSSAFPALASRVPNRMPAVLPGIPSSTCAHGHSPKTCPTCWRERESTRLQQNRDAIRADIDKGVRR